MVLLEHMLRLREWHFIWIAVVLSEGTVSVMGYVLLGSVPWHYLVTGGVTSLLAATVCIALIKAIRDAGEAQLRCSHEVLQRRLLFERTLAGISARFVSDADFDRAVSGSLADLGRVTGAGRAYLFLLREEGALMDNTHEWCAEAVTPEIQTLQNLPAAMFPWWMARLRAHEVLHITDVSALPAEAAAEREILERQAIKSLLALPVSAGTELAGFIGLDNVATTGPWHGEDIDLLRVAAEVIGHALQNRRLGEHILASERKHRELVESVEVVVYEVDAQTFQLTYVSPTVQGLLGYTAEQVVRTLTWTWKDLIHPEDLERVVSTCQAETAAGRSHVVEYRMYAADGRVVWVRDVCTVSVKNGQPVAVRGVLIDMTGQKQAEMSLRESEARFTSFMHHLPGVAVIKDQQGRYLYANTVLEALLRLEPGAWRGKTDQDLFPADIAVQFTVNDRTVLGSGKALEMNDCLRTEQGETHWLTIKFPMIENDGTPTMLGGIALNITEQKRLEDQLRQVQKMEAIGRLAGGIAHDFNNLLTVIKGYSELLLAQVGPDDPSRRPVEEIKKAGDRAALLTQQLLAFSRRQVVQPKVLDLNTVVTNMSDMLRRLIGEPIHLAVRLGPAVGLVKADPGQLDQVLLNLAVNARDAMPYGGTLTIETANVEREAQKPFVRLVVRDTGHGMDQETRSHMFEPFFTTKETGKGTGLGLATVYGIVIQSGGMIEVDSAPGQGTTVTIDLPRVAAAVRPVERAAVVDTSAPAAETILLVEDEPIVRAFVRDVLRVKGYVVLEAGSGEEGLRLCREYAGTIHVLLTDVVMPGMSGRQLAQQAKAARPDLKVLFMSGYTDDEVLRHGVSAAGTAFLQKPFSPETLARKLHEILMSSHEG